MANTPDWRPDASHTNNGAALPANLQPVHERLEADGKRWQRRAPTGQALRSWARSNLAEQTPASATIAPPPQTTHDARRPSFRGRGEPMETQTSPNRARWRALAGAAAAVLVVGALATLLIHGANQRGLGGNPHATKTSGSPISSPSIKRIGGVVVAVAPGDPQIVYTATRDTPARSTDGGKTYYPLTAPHTDLTTIVDAWMSVSPLDPSHVLFQLDGVTSAGCASPGLPTPPTGNGAPTATPGATGLQGNLPVLANLSGDTLCSYEFFSVNGGQSWSPMTLPGNLQLGVANMLRGDIDEDREPFFQAQGTRLYAMAAPNVQFGLLSTAYDTHIMVSDDGGLTWRVVDSQLTKAGALICDFAAAPTGSTLYAVATASASCQSGTITPGDKALYRSDDAGQTWNKVSELPSQGEQGMTVAASGALYIFAPDTTTTTSAVTSSIQAVVNGVTVTMTYVQAARYALVSQDHGATFQSAPNAGLPTPDKQVLNGPLGVLSDGSVLYANRASLHSSTLIAWKPGDAAWRQLAQTTLGQIATVVVTPNANGGDTLTIVDTSGALTTVKVQD